MGTLKQAKPWCETPALFCSMANVDCITITTYHIIHLTLESPSLPPSFAPSSLIVAGDSRRYSGGSAHALQRTAPSDSIVPALEMATASRLLQRTIGMAVDPQIPSVASDGATGSLTSPFVARL